MSSDPEKPAEKGDSNKLVLWDFKEGDVVVDATNETVELEGKMKKIDAQSLLGRIIIHWALHPGEYTGRDMSEIFHCSYDAVYPNMRKAFAFYRDSRGFFVENVRDKNPITYLIERMP